MITPAPSTDLASQPTPQPNLRRRARIMRTQEQWKALLDEFNTGGHALCYDKTPWHLV